tara:strand:- start:192 stop:914 length:723 start_codon:yes stop_codon:yes gene_type:complete
MIRNIYETIKTIFVKILLTSFRYQNVDFESFLINKSHEKTYEILHEELSASLIFTDKFEFWDYCINDVIDNNQMNIENKLVLEFGVGAGNSINYFANKLNKKNLKIYGFDTFFGNPEIWPGTDNVVGDSNQLGKIPNNLKFNVEIIKGKIEDTLDPFFKENNKQIALIHIDVNIFSTSKHILEKIKPRISKGTVIIFDELVNYPFWWTNGEYKALKEVLDDKDYHFIAFDKAKKAAIKIR